MGFPAVDQPVALPLPFELDKGTYMKSFQCLVYARKLWKLWNFELSLLSAEQSLQYRIPGTWKTFFFDFRLDYRATRNTKSFRVCIFEWTWSSKNLASTPIRAALPLASLEFVGYGCHAPPGPIIQSPCLRTMYSCFSIGFFSMRSSHNSRSDDTMIFRRFFCGSSQKVGGEIYSNGCLPICLNQISILLVFDMNPWTRTRVTPNAKSKGIPILSVPCSWSALWSHGKVPSSCKGDLTWAQRSLASAVVAN